MNRAFAIASVVLLAVALGCGRYGPPRRTRGPVPRPAPASAVLGSDPAAVSAPPVANDGEAECEEPAEEQP